MEDERQRRGNKEWHPARTQRRLYRDEALKKQVTGPARLTEGKNEM